MRPALLVALALVAAVAGAQDAPLVPEVYLAPEYTAPEDAPSSVVVAASDEPGERLVVTGRVIHGSTPIAGASLFVFQTDVNGVYAPGLTSPEAELEPRLHGALRTDAGGRYRFETIRPGSYDGNAAHVHYIVIAEGYKPRLFDLWFQDDPILVARREAGEPLVEVETLDGAPAFYAPHELGTAFRARVLAGDHPRSAAVVGHVRSEAGVWEQVEGTVAELAQSRFDLRILYRPVWSHAMAGLKWGAIVGVGLKLLDTTVLLAAIHPSLALMFLVAVGVCFIPRIGWMGIALIAFMMSLVAK